MSSVQPTIAKTTNKSACIARLGAKASINRHNSIKQAADTGGKIINFLHKHIERLADEAADECFTKVEIPLLLSDYGMPLAYFIPSMDSAFKDRLLSTVEDLIRDEFAAKWMAADLAGNNGLSFYSNMNVDQMIVRLDFSAATAEHTSNLEASEAGSSRAPIASGVGSSGVKAEVKPEMGSTDADGTIVIE